MGAFPIIGLCGKALPERVAFLELAVCERVGKCYIIVFERVAEIHLNPFSPDIKCIFSLLFPIHFS